MPSANLVESTRRYLNLYNIYVNETWLTECLEFFLSELTENDINVIHSGVKEQYYLNDLRDICNGCLPANLKLKKEIILPNKYILQINSIIDIGKPAYQQYMELKKIDLGNIEATKTYEERIAACRMLKLNMTDGVQDVVGIEYRTIKSLNTNKPPGFKILIKGPVKCKNGVMLLEEKNCEPLDGEVDILMENNSQLKVLERQLRLHDPDKMRCITASASISQPSGSQISETSITSSVVLDSIPSTSRNTPTSNAREQLTLDSPKSGIISGRSELIEENDFQDVDIDIDPQELDRIEAEFTEKLNDSNDILMPPEKKLKTDRNDEFPDDDDDLVLLNSNEEHFSDVDENYVFNENGNEIINIKDMNKINDKLFKSFIVKARIVNILSKLLVTKEFWKLNCNITDDSDNIDVNFSNEVLQRVIGYTPKEMYKLRKEIKSQPQLKEKANLIIRDAKEKLKNLNCKMVIEFISDSNIPTVTDLIDYY